MPFIQVVQPWFLSCNNSLTSFFFTFKIIAYLKDKGPICRCVQMFWTYLFFCDWLGMSKSFDLGFSLGMFYQRSTNMPLWMIKWLTNFPMHLSRFHKLIFKNVSPTLKDWARGDKYGKKCALILYWSLKNETHLWRQGMWFLVHVPSYLHVKLFVYDVCDLCLIESFNFVIYNFFFPLLTLNWNLIVQKCLYVDDNELVHNVFMAVLTFSFVIELPSCGKLISFHIIVGKCNNDDCGIYCQYFHRLFYNYNPFFSHVLDLTFNIV